MSSLKDLIDPTLQLASPEEPEVAPAEDSVLQAVRVRAAQLQADTTVDLDIPGYEGILVGRYRAVSISRFNRVAGDELHIPFLDWRTAADALGTALVGLYGYRSGELVPLYESGDPARYDAELAQTLGLGTTEHTARAVMVALFGGGGKGESRVWQHFNHYQSWLMEGNTAQEVADHAVGEPES